MELVHSAEPETEIDNVILPLQNVDGVVKGGDNNGKYASMIFANETWNKLGEMGLHDLVFLWPNVNAHGT